MKGAVLLVVLFHILSESSTGASALGGFDEAAYPKSEVLDLGYKLFWKVNETGNSIRFGLKAKTAGFVALGVSEVGAMVGSDVAVGSVEGGRAIVLDYFIFNRSIGGVLPDVQQDITTKSGEQYKDSDGSTWTALEFERPLISADINDRSIVEGTNTIIWSMGDTPALKYHGSSRGGKQLTLYGGPFEDPIVLPGSETLNLTVSSYQVPTNYTTNACTFYNISLPEKRHVISWTTNVNSNVPESVHHLIVVACSAQELEEHPEVTTYANTECTKLYVCSQFFSAWAIGGKPFVLPENVGLPLGPGGTTHLIFQVHYTNPSGRSDIVDQSQVSYSLAPQLRPIDAGVWPVGPAWDPLISIPPNQASWTVQSSCSPTCTDATVKDSVTLFAALTHMHTTGTQAWTDIVRGNEIIPVARIDYYDSVFQQTQRLAKPVTLEAGDALVTTCVWDTTSRNTTTLGGPSTQDEMCLQVLLYWPLKEEIGTCFDICTDPATQLPQPAFNGAGNLSYFCTITNYIPTSETCTYPLRGGQNVVQKKLAGDSSSSLTAGDVSQLSNRSVPASLEGAPPAGGGACSWTAPGKPWSFQGGTWLTTAIWASLTTLGVWFQALA